ncbi:hypothetical protein DSO57_1011451 [Entomophthora muscae]|uniref:Uncharacterized protein n=1 Tax=Entomophthora muscae TaxID=34485 RepID=A0ACC2RL17_9FUNG|nr:hypothetical protein DSO57_1011451 [Entomophthora muscae]
MVMKTYSIGDVAAHNTEQDCWIIVQGKVYDMTPFLDEHPGGKKIVLKVAGQDATKQFDNFHNQAILDKYTPKLCIGKIGESSDVTLTAQEDHEPAEDEEDTSIGFGDMVPFGDPAWYQDYESPYYNEHHREVRNAMRKFVDQEIMPFCFEWDEKKEVPKSVIKRCGDLGILANICGHPFPKKYFKGKIMGVVDSEHQDALMEFVICDELSRCGSGGVVWALVGGLGIGLPPVTQFASEKLQDRIVPGCIAGTEYCCLAITEPSAGSDVANIQTSAVKSADGKHYIVNGEKKWITNGVFADYFTTAVRTGGKGMGGISLLLIERTMPGVKTRQMQCSGMWASGTAYVTFEDVMVPVENVIGQENKGFKYIMHNFNHERMGICIQANRFSRVCFEEALKYTNKRKTFGKRLIEHPVIRFKFAQMARHIEATHCWMESLLYQTITMPQDMQMLRLGGPIALLKAQATQTFELVARESAQIFGGLAYSRGGQGEKVERLYREVRAYAIPGGSEEIMLDLGMRQSVKVAKFLNAKF